MVNTSGMTDAEVTQINVAATDEYAKIFEERALDEIQDKLDDMNKGDKKEWIAS
jgi:hypothetical protein